MSASFGTLLALALDPGSRAATGAWRLEEATAPVGLAISGEEIFVAAADGGVWVFARP